MRWTVLYLRSHRLSEGLAATVLLTAVIWALTASFSRQPAATANVVMMATSLAVVALSTTLSSTDDQLERTAALPWPPRRAAHLLGLSGCVSVLLALTLITDTTFGPFGFVVRDALGLTGLAALGAVLLGPHRAWFPVVAWCTPVVFMATVGQQQVLTWMIQPVSSRPAALTAIALATVGILGYAVLGPPRRIQADLAGAAS
jgi:hypothetical protein